MNILVADPDPEEQRLLSEYLRQNNAPSSITCFADPLLAVKFGANNLVDELYTVAGMRRLSGFELAKMLRVFSPAVRLHFIADTEQERTDAMRLMAESCILRPVTENKLRSAENSRQ